MTYIVDQDVDRAKLVDGGGHGLVDGIVVAYVCRTVNDLALRAGGLELLLQRG